MSQPDTAAEPIPLHDLTGFQRDVLLAIGQESEPHGLRIKDMLEGMYEGKEVNHGRLYPNLDTLVERGLVEKGAVDRRTNYYVLTPRGERELDAYASYVDARVE